MSSNPPPQPPQQPPHPPQSSKTSFTADTDYSQGLYRCKHGTGSLLNHNNYRQWYSDIIGFLEADGALDIVTGDERRPGGAAALRDYRKRADKAKALLSTSCGPSVRFYLTGILDPADMWTELKKLDIAAQDSGRSALWTSFLMMQIDPSSPVGISDFIAKANTIRRQLHDTPQAIPDDAYISILLARLPDSAKQIKEVIIQQPAATKTAIYVGRTLTEWETRERLQKDTNSSTNLSNTSGNALAVYPSGYRGSPQGNYRGSFNPRNHSGYRVDKGQASSSQNNSQNTSRITCFHCGRRGHKRENCRIKKRADSVFRKQRGGRGGGKKEDDD